MKKRIILTASAITLVAALTAGASYAWFTDGAAASPNGVTAGYLDISLTSATNAESDPLLFPADGVHMVDYTLTNESDIPVIAQFAPGDLDVYVMPTGSLVGGYVTDAARALYGPMAPNERKNAFVSDTYDEVETAVTVATGSASAYLGGTEGNHYFRLAAGASADFSYTVALTADAGNEYQYAVFTMAGVNAIATQDIEAAVADEFGAFVATLIYSTAP